jgi:diguanylate cyclase (GGDEF)-like protein
MMLLSSLRRYWQGRFRSWQRRGKPALQAANDVGDMPGKFPDKQEVMVLINDILGATFTRRSHGLGVMLLAVVNHQQVCLTYGQRRADTLMALVSDQLEQTLARVSSLHALSAQLGPSEFLVLTHDTNDASAQRALCDLLLDTLNASYRLGEVVVNVRVVIGMAPAQHNYRDAQDVLQCADIALQGAMHRGQGNLVVFEPSMRRSLMARQILENELITALKHEQLELVYQPIVATQTGSLVGLEALVRWNHPLRGRLQPIDFISTAEDASLVCHLDLEVLRLAMRAMSDWTQAGMWQSTWFLSVNLSAQHFNQGGFFKRLQAMQLEHGISCESLRLEITESAMLQHIDVARQELTLLRDAGYQIYMDDFGTGYSSFGQLHELPFTALKIDKSFIDPVVSRFDRQAMVTFMVQMAHKLGIKVVAEGVETIEQFLMLKDINCEYAQGHYISPALTQRGATEWISHAGRVRLLA